MGTKVALPDASFSSQAVSSLRQPAQLATNFHIRFVSIKLDKSFEVLTTNNMPLRVATQCTREIFRRFRGSYYLHFQGLILWEPSMGASHITHAPTEKVAICKAYFHGTS
jgi:hypothetical protein